MGAPSAAQPAASPRTTRQGWIALIVILTAALVVRALYLGEASGWPDYLKPGSDAGFHNYWARGLVTGDWTPPAGMPDPHLTAVPYIRAPGYPYFLAAVYELFGITPLPIRLVQIVLGVGSCALAFVIGRRWFGSVVGLMWSGGMMLYWGFTYFDMELQAVGPLVFLLLLAFFLLGKWWDRRACGWAALAGIVLGGCALLRPNVLPLVPLVAAWMILTRRDAAHRRRRWFGAAGLVAGAGLAVLPATIRNARVSGEFVLISANGGINLFIGNNPEANGEISGWVDGTSFHTMYDFPAVVRAAEARVGHPLGYAGASRYYARQALHYAWSHPSRTLTLLGRKALLLLGPVEITNNKELNCTRSYSPVLSALPLTFSRVLPFALVGMVLIVGRARRRRMLTDPDRSGLALAMLALVFVAGLLLPLLPFFAAGRFRQPVVPFLLFFGAIALQAAGRAWARGDRRRLGMGALVTAALFLICQVRVVGAPPDPARWYFDRAQAWLRVDQPAAAARDFREALVRAPDFVMARQMYASLLLDAHQPAAARAVLVPALHMPSHDRATLYLQIAATYMAERRFDDAIDAYHAALDVDPGSVAAHRGLGCLLNLTGHAEEALKEFATVLKLDPANAECRMYYGLTLEALGRPDEAQSYIDEALRQQPELSAALPSAP
ncbi:MAG TPA: tetratricopeptide repeat protein [Phycisphaerae bacterium]|nr:glycosyltransferase family 39 protein [Phycisphaerales bacterium]HRX84051.1 tetratricopeptide repeat protein [Phycisphaerae bacterium]